MTDTDRHQDAQAPKDAAELDTAQLDQVVGGDGATTLTVHVSDIQITKHVDKASPILFQN